jgi:hypothetical protein
MPSKFCQPGRAVSLHKPLRGSVFCPRRHLFCHSSSALSRRRVGAPIESMLTDGKKRAAPKMRPAYADGVQCQSSAVRTADDAARIDWPRLFDGKRRPERVAPDAGRADLARGALCPGDRVWDCASFLITLAMATLATSLGSWSPSPHTQWGRLPWKHGVEWESA